MLSSSQATAQKQLAHELLAHAFCCTMQSSHYTKSLESAICVVHVVNAKDQKTPGIEKNMRLQHRICVEPVVNANEQKSEQIRRWTRW